MNFIIAIILIVLALTGMTLRRVYFALPSRELKRRAEAGDADSIILYRAVAYGSGLSILLWFFISLTLAGSFVLLAKSLSELVAIIFFAFIIFMIFSWMPNTKKEHFSLTLTKLLTPIVAKDLSTLRPLFTKIPNKIFDHYEDKGTNIYEVKDLLDLLKKQAKQPGSRLTKQELDTVKHSINFSYKKVNDILVPRKLVKAVQSEATIGPILINDLHENHQDYVLVKDGPKGDVIGILAFKDLGIKSQGLVKNLMSDTLYYLHEDDELISAINAYFITGSPVFVVVNDSEEYVGIATIEAVIKELVGHIPKEDFESYTSRTAVALKYAPKVGSVQEDPEVLE
jgi:CBS domain containing-hemolysin-like protein